MNRGSGCVFEHCGVVPVDIYEIGNLSPLEEAIYKNDITTFKQLISEGNTVTMKLKIGSMSCIEYAAMLGYTDILKLFIENSVNNEVVKKYFSMDDVVDQAKYISKNKKIFFDEEALAEINRYEAALFTAVEYNQPKVVELMLDIGAKASNIHPFMNNGTLKHVDIKGLAVLRGHNDCLKVLERKLPETNNNS